MNVQNPKSRIAERVSRETMDRLELYHALLLKWQRTINLVAPSTIEAAWSRHFTDSTQLFDLAPKAASRWLDLGSGGGFPGLVIAAMAVEVRPNLKVILVESDIRKCGFMREAARKMDLSVDILPQRIADIPLQNANVVSARALCSLPSLINHASRHAAPGACLLFLKGISHKGELETIPRDWQTAVETIQSQTDPDAVVLRFTVPNLKKDP